MCTSKFCPLHPTLNSSSWASPPQACHSHITLPFWPCTPSASLGLSWLSLAPSPLYSLSLSAYQHSLMAKFRLPAMFSLLFSHRSLDFPRCLCCILLHIYNKNLPLNHTLEWPCPFSPYMRGKARISDLIPLDFMPDM